MAAEIPAEGRLPLLDIVVPIHWENHALLMFAVWFVLVPAAVAFIRFGKPRPTPYGIPRGTGRFDRRLVWWTIHFWGLYLAIGLAVGGVAFAMLLTGGFSGTLHGWFGLATLGLGALQIVSSWFRGSHGGRHGAHSDPGDPATWRGDHYDMTPTRRWFEAYHRTGGYFALVLALGAVTTGLAQLWLPAIAVALGIVLALALGLAVVLTGLGRVHDTYRSVYGNHPDHPWNRARREL